jgi:hypothetical protein
VSGDHANPEGSMDHLIQLLLGPAGTLVLALTILFGGWKKWWVFGWQYKDAVTEKNEWKEAALRGTALAEKVVSIKETEQKGK